MNKTIIVTLISTVLMTTGCVSQKTFDKDMGLERQINQQLLNEVNADEVKIVKMRDRLRITVKDEIFFPEGVAEVSKEGKSILDKLVPTLQKVTDHRIEIEGYTDNVPIGQHLRHVYPTNWELSAARAAEVVKYLQKQGIDPSRLTAAGHGEYKPVEPNTTPGGRQANRRTDVDLMPILDQ